MNISNLLERVKKIKRSDIVLWIVFVLYVFVIVFGNIFLDIDDQVIKFNASAMSGFWWMALSVFQVIVGFLAIGVTVLVFYFTVGGVLGWFKESELHKRKLSMFLDLLGILVIIIFASLLFVLLYLSGFIFSLYKFLQNILFPALVDGTNWILSNIFGWIISGVVGNFFYDLLKKNFGSKNRK
jgi:hypothetical protein